MNQGLTNVKFLADKSGKSNINAMQEWFLNNNVEIYMRPRKDKDILPCITIFQNNSNEKPEMKHMADLSAETIILLPQEIGRPIAYIVKPFVPTGYDPSTGLITFGDDVVGFQNVTPGQILVDPDKGEGFIIQNINGEGLYIEPNIRLDASRLAIVPKYQYYVARIEHIFASESYTVGIHAHGDPQALIWLHTIALYTILRYKESLLEANGFSESVINSGEIMEDPNYEGPGGEEAYVKIITITGQVEQTFIKAPHRVIEIAELTDRVNCDDYTGGIKIISNTEPDTLQQQENQNWFPVTESEES
jgi:hypothetical protein